MPMAGPMSSLRLLKETDREVQRLSHVSALLSWDQETCLPERGVADRSEQRAALEGMIHGKLTAPRIGRHLERLAAREDGSTDRLDLAPIDRAFLREFRRRYLRRVRIPARLVTELARETAVAQARWVEARRRSDFALFAPHLGRVLELVREMAQRLGYERDMYDALLDEYEPWMKTVELERIFDRFQPPLGRLLERIQGSGVQVDDSFLRRRYDVDRQRAFSRQVLDAMGWDFRRGRLDESAHPFTTTLGSSDVRLTTRYLPDFFNTGIFGTIHEGGHGLYELGVAEELHGSLLADGTSMGIHESQSRFWENFVGRSLDFWRHFFPRLQQLFPDALQGVGLEPFYRAINRVTPSHIRVEADEVTYNLHILLRFRLEKRLLDGRLSVADLPEAWRQESARLLGIVPPDDASGCLQDIHWSIGSFGYFPTYALGNLYAAQFYHAMRRDLPGALGEWQAGNLAPTLAWLREKIHAAGRTVPAPEMCRKASGGDLDPARYIDYLEGKFGAIYGF